MKIMAIGIILVVVGCSILGWLIKEAYKNNKDESTKYKIPLFILDNIRCITRYKWINHYLWSYFIRSSFNNLLPTLKLTECLS
jgi:hypothetical protein